MYSFNFMLPSLSTPFHSLQLKISNCALLWFLRHNIYIPPYETVYDYFVDEETGNFSLWEDRIDLRPRADVPSDSSYVALHQVSVCFFFAKRTSFWKFIADAFILTSSCLVSALWFPPRRRIFDNWQGVYIKCYCGRTFHLPQFERTFISGCLLPD